MSLSFDFSVDVYTVTLSPGMVDRNTELVTQSCSNMCSQTVTEPNLKITKLKNEPVREKTNNLPMRKRRRRSASR